MTDKPKTEIIILHETVMQSWLRDLSSLAVSIAMVGVGKWIGSEALQWVGALLFFAVLLGQVKGSKDKLSIQKARARLDELEKEWSKPQ